MTTREKRSEAPRACAWCLTGHHLQSPTSKGCTRHQRNVRPCPCEQPVHESVERAERERARLEEELGGEMDLPAMWSYSDFTGGPE